MAAQLPNIKSKMELVLLAEYSYLQLLEVADFYVNLYTENFPFMRCPLKYFSKDAGSF
jgi:hypothetical protein